MDKTYKKFLESGIDLTAVGIQRRKENTPYFCTPKGASIFGWAGTDGIHFCFIRGFGGMVFSVNPMSTYPNYIYPLAENFADFLRLLLACGHEAVLEQAWMWDEDQFQAFLQEQTVTKEQQSTLKMLSEIMKMRPIEEPWAYIKKLQSTFDYSRIRYTEDYYDIDMNPSAEPDFSEWKVYFDGNFWGYHGRDHAGKEIRIDQEFEWGGYRWRIPAVYSCSKGLVIDFCMQVKTEQIRSFMKKWNLSPANDSEEAFTAEQQLELELENPLCFHFYPHIRLNGKELQNSHGCSICFTPCLPEEIIHVPEEKQIMNYYSLDKDFGWVICRNAFPWAGSRRPKVKSLFLTMEQQPVQIPGPHFQLHEAGESFSFFNPFSKISYTLTADKIEKEEISRSCFDSERWIYPTNCKRMSYRIFPEPEEDIRVLDCDEGDKPVEVKTEKSERYYPESSSICIIGGADGPTEIVWGKDPQGKLHTVYSALHFEPVQRDIEWRMVFYTRQFEACTFLLYQEKNI